MSAKADRRWMYARGDGYGCLSTDYCDKLDEFLDFVYCSDQFVERGMIKCPCKNIPYQLLNMVKYHLMKYGFMPLYTIWWAHGESENIGQCSNTLPDYDDDHYQGCTQMVTDSMNQPRSVPLDHSHYWEEQDPNLIAKGFYDMLRDDDVPLDVRNGQSCKQLHGPQTLPTTPQSSPVVHQDSSIVPQSSPIMTQNSPTGGSNSTSQIHANSLNRAHIYLIGGQFHGSVGRRIVQILKSMFRGSWSSWKNVDNASKEAMWDRFRTYRWNDEDEAVIRNQWEKVLKDRFPDIMHEARLESEKMAQKANVIGQPDDISHLIPFNPPWIPKREMRYFKLVCVMFYFVLSLATSICQS